jgi:hypothetical protein
VRDLTVGSWKSKSSSKVVVFISVDLDQAEIGDYLDDGRLMYKPLFDDLRCWILGACQRREGSQKQLTQRFG